MQDELRGRPAFVLRRADRELGQGQRRVHLHPRAGKVQRFDLATVSRRDRRGSGRRQWPGAADADVAADAEAWAGAVAHE